MPRSRSPAAGVLLLYARGVGPTPVAIGDSIDAIVDHSQLEVWPLNVRLGMPAALPGVRPAVIVLHYTLFYDEMRPLEPRFLEYLDRCRSSYLVAMFQDEQAYLDRRIAFCGELGVDCVYTMFGPEPARRIYHDEAGVESVVSAIPGYVSDRLRQLGSELRIDDERRPIDIGYRGRRPPAEWGAAALEKYEIAIEFERHAAGSDLRLDIETSEQKRIYGRDWYRFMSSCRATLGTESGTEITHHGGTIPYRTISPRHLEAAAFESCQILFEGDYSGLMEPLVHYIPLRKDFSNFEEAIERYRDGEQRRTIAARARRHLVDGDRVSYRGFVAEFDRRLEAAGATPSSGSAFASARIRVAVASPRPRRRIRALLSSWKLRARTRLRSSGTG